MKKKSKVVIVSGYFNPIHIGHVRMIREAAKLGDFLYVIVNNDKQVKLKGSVPFMKELDRMEIVSLIKGVEYSLLSIDKDLTVCESLERLKGLGDVDMIFANGGDRGKKNVPEVETCKRLGIDMAWNVGGKKIRASSELISKAFKRGWKK